MSLCTHALGPSCIEWLPWRRRSVSMRKLNPLFSLTLFCMLLHECQSCLSCSLAFLLCVPRGRFRSAQSATVHEGIPGIA